MESPRVVVLVVSRVSLAVLDLVGLQEVQFEVCVNLALFSHYRASRLEQRNVAVSSVGTIIDYNR